MFYCKAISFIFRSLPLRFFSKGFKVRYRNNIGLLPNLEQNKYVVYDEKQMFLSVNTFP